MKREQIMEAAQRLLRMRAVYDRLTGKPEPISPNRLDGDGRSRRSVIAALQTHGWLTSNKQPICAGPAAYDDVRSEWPDLPQIWRDTLSAPPERRILSRCERAGTRLHWPGEPYPYSTRDLRLTLGHLKWIAEHPQDFKIRKCCGYGTKAPTELSIGTPSPEWSLTEPQWGFYVSDATLDLIIDRLVKARLLRERFEGSAPWAIGQYTQVKEWHVIANIEVLQDLDDTDWTPERWAAAFGEAAKLAHQEAVEKARLASERAFHHERICLAVERLGGWNVVASLLATEIEGKGP